MCSLEIPELWIQWSFAAIALIQWNWGNRENENGKQECVKWNCSQFKWLRNVWSAFFASVFISTVARSTIFILWLRNRNFSGLPLVVESSIVCDIPYSGAPQAKQTNIHWVMSFANTSIYIHYIKFIATSCYRLNYHQKLTKLKTEALNRKYHDHTSVTKIDFSYEAIVE